MATLIAVSNYTDTSILAHTPKGTENSVDSVGGSPSSVGP